MYNLTHLIQNIIKLLSYNRIIKEDHDLNWRLGFLLIMFILFCVGCQQNNTENTHPNETPHNQYMQISNQNKDGDGDLNNEQLATHLANIASDVPNVNNATAIIAGPYAVVGIDVDQHLDRSRVGTIKYSVSEALQHDPYGKTAVVIADGDIMERIRLMGIKIQEGYPIQGIVDELSAIVGRYMPDFPINENQPSNPDQNKDIISEEEEENLENIEKEQSNE